jgi:hypothetical protein
MFYTIFDKFQLQHYSLTWQQTLRSREIAKNGYRALGDIKKAKAFVKNISNYSQQTYIESFREIVIFSLYDLAEIPISSYFFVS